MTLLRELIVALTLVALATSPARAQAGSDPDPAGLGDRGLVAREQALLDLTNPFTVMCVACHPDDEDGATLTVERRRYGARTVTLFATSGEGGQNAVGPELYDALGRIRERETVEASTLQGSEPYFLRLADFGFSKSGDEAMRVWQRQAGGHENLLKMFVAAIRALKPDAIITNHDTSTGHGQHQATGRLLVEAFEIAGDRTRFPDAGPAWQPQALYVRAPRDATDGVAIESDLYDATRGLTYREQAFRALLRHATQGPWRLESLRGVARYLPVSVRATAPAGIGSPLTAGLALPPNAFSIANAPAAPRDRLVADLRGALSSATVDDRYRGEIVAGLLAALDTSVDLAVTPDDPVAGGPATARVLVTRAGDAAVAVRQVHVTSTNVAAVEDDLGARGAEVARGKTLAVERPLDTETLVEPDARPPEIGAGFGRFSSVARGPAGTHVERLTALVELAIDGASVPVELTRALYFAPPVRVTALGGGRAVAVTNRLATPLALRVEADGRPVAAPRTAAPRAEIVVEIPATASTVRVLGHVVGSETGDAPLAALEIPRLPEGVQVVPDLRVGYVRSYDFTLPEALERLGVAHRELTPEAVREGDLSGLDTIVVDNRAYLKYPELARHNARLLEFVRDGGTLVVFYHKTEEYDAALAPYPIEIGRSRITDENAPVRLLAPEHPLLTTPNRITAADFGGWVQERGLYFPAKWAPEYTPLLASSDAGEEPLTGGLLVAPYGKGTFVYTSYVWYRQLRGLVPGGYRVFANMISLGGR